MFPYGYTPRVYGGFPESHFPGKRFPRTALSQRPRVVCRGGVGITSTIMAAASWSTVQRPTDCKYITTIYFFRPLNNYRSTSAFACVHFTYSGTTAVSSPLSAQTLPRKTTPLPLQCLSVKVTFRETSVNPPM